MVLDVNVTIVQPVAAALQAERPVEPDTVPPKRQRTGSKPKSPITCQHADEMGRIVLDVVTGGARFVAGVGRTRPARIHGDGPARSTGLTVPLHSARTASPCRS